MTHGFRARCRFAMRRRRGVTRRARAIVESDRGGFVFERVGARRRNVCVASSATSSGADISRVVGRLPSVAECRHRHSRSSFTARLPHGIPVSMALPRCSNAVRLLAVCRARRSQAAMTGSGCRKLRSRAGVFRLPQFEPAIGVAIVARNAESAIGTAPSGLPTGYESV